MASTVEKCLKSQKSLKSRSCYRCAQTAVLKYQEKRKGKKFGALVWSVPKTSVSKFEKVGKFRIFPLRPKSGRKKRKNKKSSNCGASEWLVPWTSYCLKSLKSQKSRKRRSFGALD